MGSTKRGELERTADMLSEMLSNKKPLSEIFYFLHDCQTEIKDLKQLAEIFLRREKGSNNPQY